MSHRWQAAGWHTADIGPAVAAAHTIAADVAVGLSVDTVDSADIADSSRLLHSAAVEELAWSHCSTHTMHSDTAPCYCHRSEAAEAAEAAETRS